MKTHAVLREEHQRFELNDGAQDPSVPVASTRRRVRKSSSSGLRIVASSVGESLNNSPTERVIWDSVLPGFGVRLRRQRRPVWIVQWRQGRRTIRRTLGTVEALSRDQAQAAAREVLAQRELGLAPLKTAPRFADFVDVFLRDCAGRWKPATVAVHRLQCRTVLVPAFGNQRVDAIARADVITWFEGLQGGCNRALSVLSSLMLHAETLGLRPEGSNPCAGLRRKKSGFKARYPTRADYRKLGRALDEFSAGHATEVAMIRFLGLTGARRGEALALRWSDVESHRAVLPDSKTGPKTIWLAAPVLALLKRVPKSDDGPYVFGAGDRLAVQQRLAHFWLQLRHRTGLENLRLHDLRHGFASVGVSHGEDLRTIAGLLGHADFATTLGYAHLAEAPVAAAAQRVSQKLANALKPTAPVEPLQVLDPPVTDPEERTWLRHISAYRNQSLRLQVFCQQRRLDPLAFHQALCRFQQRHRLEYRRQQGGISS